MLFRKEKVNVEPSPLDKEIDSVIKSLKSYSADTDDYSKAVNNLERLVALKKDLCGEDKKTKLEAFKDIMKKLFEKIYSNYVSKGVPVYLGEFGCVNRATEREQLFQQYYFKYFAKLAKTHGVPAVLWDNGAKGAGEEKHAFIDHGTGEYCSTGAQYAIQALIGSYNSILTLEDVYRNAPK